MDESRLYKQFKLIVDIARQSIDRTEFEQVVRKALEETARLIDLQAVSLSLWDDDSGRLAPVKYPEEGDFVGLLDDLEKNLLKDLRNKRHLGSGYFSFRGETPMAVFTLPIQRPGPPESDEAEIIGAIIGLRAGSDTLIKDDEFLNGLTTSLANALIVDLVNRFEEPNQKRILKTAAARVNHETNNQLQAILGTVQLLLSEDEKSPQLDEKLLNKLKLIEGAANKITEFNRRLMQADKIKFMKYIDGSDMLALPGDEEYPEE